MQRLNQAVLDCMQALRRRLHDEFCVDIRLSQPDAVESLLIACLHSADRETHNLGIRLAAMSDAETAGKAAEPAASGRH